MKILRLAFLLFTLSLIGCASGELALQSGDLLFQANPPSEKTKAIKGAGKGYNGLEFSHVGIVDIQGIDTMVIEATTQGVRSIPIAIFLKESDKIKDKPYVFVGRLLPKYHYLIPSSIERAKKEIGKVYDSVFLPNNNALYCTELVYESFRDKDNKPIFESKPMSFKDKKTGMYYQVWVDFYKKVGIPIPEGIIGTNPNDMSNSKAIKIIKKGRK